MDIAHWGIGAEYSGPLEISGSAEFPKDGLWDVHTGFSVNYVYANGVTVNCADDSINRSGVTFVGAEGQVFVTRGQITASSKTILKSVIGVNDIRLPQSSDHMRNWLNAVRSRKDPIASVEIGHRSCTACILGDIAMVTGQKLKWDPVGERFLNSEQGNSLLSRPMRGSWTI